jgi:hypothetical protein
MPFKSQQTNRNQKDALKSANIAGPNASATVNTAAINLESPNGASVFPAGGEVTVRLAKNGRIVNGQGADTDILVASAKAYISAANKLHNNTLRTHPQPV